ncbi:hypothetical protein RFI_39018 [Reticulomyxa filosa]|uniref:Caspase family p20 domain-containing protein n=1 Tax=Reticulomyxa filosa TaxID=46433 RepID=X6LAC5_RETFI|nr:hypothetical protein RFI_39018 [Reticulomyxa filosa]|eukprot:ETN98478.1 hypothetical protein RFI_39018 [Reticulomyxa filosa]
MRKKKMAHVQLDSTATKCIYLSQLTHSELCDKICKVLDRSTLEMMAKMQFLMQIIGTDRAKLIETDEDVIQTFKTSKQPLFQLSWKYSLSANLNTTIRVVRNALVAMIGISEYDDNKKWANLPNIKEDDTVNFKDLFEKELNYDFVHNQEARMTKEGVKDFFSNLMLSRELHKNSMNYDALIVILCANGDEGDVLTSSDGKGVSIDEIRHSFDCDNLEAFKNCPKIFIVDIGRGDSIPKAYKMVMRGREQPLRYGHNDDGFFTIWSTTKGHKVADFSHLSTGIKDVFSRFKDNCSLHQMIHQVRNNIRKKNNGEWYCVEVQDTTLYDIILAPKKRHWIQR